MSVNNDLNAIQKFLMRNKNVSKTLKTIDEQRDPELLQNESALKN
jgi:hypothetical protein